MILRTYASNQPLSLGLLPVTTLLVLFMAAARGRLEALHADFPADRLFEGWYSSPYALAALSGVLILLGAYLANVVFNRHEFFNVPVYIPAFMYSLLATTLAVIQLSIPVLLANLFLLLGLNRQLKIFQQPRVLAEYFEAGLYYGIAALCFPPYLSLAVAVWAGTMVFRAFHWREYLLPLIAFAVPFVYWISWLYFYDNLSALVLFHKWVSFDVQSFFSSWERSERVFGITILICLLFALPRYLFLNERSSNRSKTIRILFFLVALAAAGSYFLAYALTWKWIIMALLLPVAFTLGYWFANYRVSLAGPFLFYAILITSLWCVVSALI